MSQETVRIAPAVRAQPVIVQRSRARLRLREIHWGLGAPLFGPVHHGGPSLQQHLQRRMRMPVHAGSAGRGGGGSRRCPAARYGREKPLRGKGRSPKTSQEAPLDIGWRRGLPAARGLAHLRLPHLGWPGGALVWRGSTATGQRRPRARSAMWTGLCCPRSRRGSCRKLRALEICREAMHISLLVWAVIVILGSRVGTLTEALPLRVKLSRRRFALT
jgi:hypothetical protein